MIPKGLLKTFTALVRSVVVTPSGQTQQCDFVLRCRRVDWIGMRRVAALQTCLSLVLALCLAPFQHVHEDHDHGVLVHAHPYAQARVHEDSRSAQMDDVDDHARAKSLDTFTLAFAPSTAPFVMPRGPVLEPVSLTAPQPVEIVEACAHDPPDADLTISRGPPA
jgi:hypothetical protein